MSRDRDPAPKPAAPGAATGVKPARAAAPAGTPASSAPSGREAGRASSAHARAQGGTASPAPNAAQRISDSAAFESLQIRFDSVGCRDLTRASKKEWLLTNGLGGYSMSTIAGLNTRRHHGLLVAAMRPPVGRAVVLSKMDETLDLPTGPLALDTNFYPGVVHPRGFENIESFTLYPLPVVTFEGPGWRLEKTVHLVHGENTVVVTYKMLPASRLRRAVRKGKAPLADEGAGTGAGGPGGSAAGEPAGRGGAPASGSSSSPARTATGSAARGAAAPVTAAGSDVAGMVAALGREASEAPGAVPEPATLPPHERLKLRVRPLFAFRAADQLSRESDRIQRTFGVRDFETRGSIVRCTPYPEWEPVYLICREARFTEAPDWYKNLEYPQERYRGLEYREDLWSYGYYEVELSVGQSLTIACTLHPPETRAPGWPAQREIERRAQVLARGIDDKPFTKRLLLAADQFLVRRERDLASVVAGYPWFTDRARDTMIALPGLMLVTGRFREAKAILRTSARALDRGMLPNRFPEGNDRPEYSSADATLWFFVAIFKYLQYTGDFDFVKTELRIPMLETIRYYEEGTRYGIRIDSDGLLRCGEPGRALTWMDARASDVPVTARAGKPVDVNALWYNALKIMERLAERFSIPSDMARFARMSERIEDTFVPAFWNESANCLYDVVGGERTDAAIRPNQILAVSLPFPLLDSESAQSVVQVVGEKLLTPVGLRTLDPQHPEYRGIYDGDPKQRHAAYHQGTVWSWLLGPYISALVKAQGAAGRTEAARILHAFEQHLQEDCLGQVSEIFWGNAPHWPRGCPAHTIAVAEILRAYREDVLERNPGRHPGVREPNLRSR